MKSFAKIVAVLACSAAVAMPAMAQEKKSSISAFGNYSKYSNQTDASGNVNVGYGYLFSPQLELGVQVMKTFGSSSMSGLGGFAQYYIKPVGKTGQLNPYGKVDMFSISGSGFTATQYSLYLGAGYELSETSEFFVEAGSQSLNSTSSGYSSKDSGTVINFGLKVRF